MNDLFLKIVNMSISASWLVLAVLIFRLILKKAPKWVNVLLWGIVAVRLVCPVSIESALSLIPSAETISPSIMTDNAPSVQTGVPALNSVINPVIGSSLAPAAGDSANPLQIWIPILAVVWAVGMAALLLYIAVSYWHLRRRVREAVRLRDNIFQSGNVASPFVLGMVKPKIYLPFTLDGQAMEHVIAHEQAHIRRGDHWWKSLGFLLLTVHWFNPLVWLSFVLLCRDIELACDEKVIKGLDSGRRADYTQALVVCSVSRFRPSALAFGEVGVKTRVKSVMNYKKPAFWGIVAAVLACLALAVCFLTNPERDSYAIRIVVPAGSQEAFVYSDEEISTTGSRIVLSAGDGLADTEVLLKSADETAEPGYVAEYLTPGMPVTLDAEKGEWFKVGINMQNPTQEDIVVYVDAENVEVRIPEAPNAGKTYLYEKEGFFGSFTVTLYNDGTFTYYEGMASSYIGSGTWEQEGDTVTLSDSDFAITNRFRLEGDDLVFIADGSSNFIYVTVKDGETFHCTGEAFNTGNGVKISDMAAFEAEILEIHEGFFLVAPVEGSMEASSADRIEVPMENMDPSLEPEVGDIIEVEYSGEILETYPARVHEVYDIRVVQEAELSAKTAFELNLAGNTSMQNKIELTEQMPFWSITVSNTGGYGIVVELGGDVYRVEPGTTATITAEERWEPGTYSVSFASAHPDGMQGRAICTVAPWVE